MAKSRPPSADARTRSVAGRWLQARGTRDLAALADLTAAGARWKSPVAGAATGRDALVARVEQGYEEADRFASRILSLECRGEKAVALVHNIGWRNGEELDSLQTLFIRVEQGLVAEVTVAVDDEEAVRRFWSDNPSS